MATKLHFIDVGQGNMTLMQLDNGAIFLYDCNVTTENRKRVLNFMARQIGWGTAINTFVCSHRDSDHMRGVKIVDEYFPIKHVWDTGVVGTSPDCAEYKDYMALRPRVGYTEVEARTYWDKGNTRPRIMNAKNDDLACDANAQSIVMKVVQRGRDSGDEIASVLLTGDTDARTWRNIIKYYNSTSLSCNLLLASHHGSITYFDDPADDKHYFTAHFRQKAPAMTIISVGPNNYGHPNNRALEFYEKHSTGSNKGNKIVRTDKHGTISVTLHSAGGWNLTRTPTKAVVKII